MMRSNTLPASDQATSERICIQILSNLQSTTATELMCLIADGVYRPQAGRLDSRTSTFRLSDDEVIDVRLFDLTEKSYQSLIDCYLAFITPDRLAQNIHEKPVRKLPSNTLVTVPDFYMPYAKMLIDSTEQPVFVVAINCNADEKKQVEQYAKDNGFLHIGDCEHNQRNRQRIETLVIKSTELVRQHKKLKTTNQAYLAALKACTLSGELTLKNYETLMHRPQRALIKAKECDWPIDYNNPHVKLYFGSLAFLNGACAGLFMKTTPALPAEVAVRIASYLDKQSAYAVPFTCRAAAQTARYELAATSSSQTAQEPEADRRGGKSSFCRIC